MPDIRYAKIMYAMQKALDIGKTKMSKSGQSIIFAQPAAGRSDLSGDLRTAMAQVEAAGIEWESIPDHEVFGVAKEDWEAFASGGHEIAKIEKKGRKWLVASNPVSGYATKIAINSASKNWEVGSTYIFKGKKEINRTQYGSTTTIFPDSPETQAIIQEEQVKKDVKEIKRWLGYVEDKAKEGYLYQRGVDQTLRRASPSLQPWG